MKHLMSNHHRKNQDSTPPITKVIQQRGKRKNLRIPLKKAIKLRTKTP